MPELRIDPIVGRRVYVAEDRAGRPNDYVDEALRASHPASERPVHMPACYFCAGNERHTPVATATVPGPDGRWQVRVVPNKYPAVRTDAAVEDAFGAHEVIIEAPEHVLDIASLALQRFAAILRVYRDRLAYWARDGRLAHAVVFKNSGCAAGASLEHVHSQLVALPYVPDAVRQEVEAGYVAVCAYAPRQPLETWVLPERHAARFELLDDDELERQAAVLQGLLRRLDRATPGAAYNLLLHTGPFNAEEPAFHWHWELVPRLTHLAGLEWGGGVHITPLSPEHAAKQLRDAM
jgi:UDPglucose--hexose-1-phosphate uridylyltransferase